jgi:glycosyltransferase involved in cell wall biosynthesis
MEILILLFYYDRPEIVRNAIHSIKNQTYKNFKVAFIDDGSIFSGKNIVEKELGNDPILDKFVFYSTFDSPQDKKNQGGSNMGKIANQAIEQISSDITLMLCDDDALMPGYLEFLNEFFTSHSKINHCYSKLLFYNPSKETYIQGMKTTSYNHPGSIYDDLNRYKDPKPCSGFDASQVAWRTSCNVSFPYPQTRAHDGVIYKQLCNYGLCYPTNFYGQVKGAFEDQLGNRWKDGKEEYKVNIS